jgi:hypothetical protein
LNQPLPFPQGGHYQKEGEKVMMSQMKNKKSLALFLLIVLSVAFPAFAQQEQQKEYVQVVNVEMILRVLKDGAPVGGLKKNDFALYENGEQCEINGFFENHRRIGHAGEDKKQLQQPRLYLLLFWVNNPEADVEGVLNRFFSSIYREGDRVILSTPSKSLELTSPQDIAAITAAFLEHWRREAKEKLSASLQLQGDLNRLLENQVRRLWEIGEKNKADEKEQKPAKEVDTSAEREISSLITQYARVLQEYRLRELSTDTTAFEAMARSMIPNKNDKFALVFYQHDSLPLYDITNVKSFCMTKGIPEDLINKIASEMSRIEEQIKNSFNIRIFSEQLKSLFIQANIQYHLLSLSPDKSDRHANAGSFFSLVKREEIFSYWDQAWQEISKITGGLKLDGDRMADALDQVIAFEDIYYHITYVPRSQGAKKRKIDIRVDRPGMQVIYGRTLEMTEWPLVKIAEISVTNQFIRLGIADFYPIHKDGVPTGFVNVDVTGRQTDSEPPHPLLSQPSETVGTIELPIAFPKPGSWDIEVQVTDQITGQQDTKKAKVEIAAVVPAPAPFAATDLSLAALLARAAAYAEKLKGAAFHFICREDVSETVFTPKSSKNPEPSTARNAWKYDYQIICREGKITENRVLLEKNRVEAHLANAQLETMFHSYFSFYMPVTILAGEKQHLYHYRLLGKERIDQKIVWRIAAACRVPGSIPSGEIWVGEEDGTVWKIQIDQTSIVGFDKMAQKAIEQGYMPEITTIHEYNLEKNGIHFPTKTTFIERYKPYGEAANKTVYVSGTGKTGITHTPFERSQTYYQYRDHLFFSVSTRVEEKSE